jgi:hypothetical protein
VSGAVRGIEEQVQQNKELATLAQQGMRKLENS